jgi:hypothetical protein
MTRRSTTGSMPGRRSEGAVGVDCSFSARSSARVVDENALVPERIS